jgi:hypothetical protein
LRKALALSFWIGVMLVVNVTLCFAQTVDTGTIDVDPTEKDYGEVAIGESSDQTFVVSNIGTGLLVVQPGLFGIDAGHFRYETDDTWLVILPGDSDDIVVFFEPTSEGPKAATMRLFSTDDSQPELDVPLSGVGFTPAPDIAVDPESWDYGTVDIPIYDITPDNYSDKTFVVTNEGELTLDISSTDLSDTDNFSMSGGGSFSLAPGETHDIVVRFDPVLPGGAKSATLNIVSNDPDEGTFPVSLSGTGRVTDLDPPEIVAFTPDDGKIYNVTDAELKDVQIQFSEPMDTASVLKNSEFVRINITDDVTEMQASINTFLYWFGDPAEAAKYDSYGCQGPYGISPGEAGMVDVTFNVDRDILDIHIEDLTIGTPEKPIGSGDTEYRLTILINGATDDTGNTLELTHLDYTYFLTQQVDVTTAGGIFDSLLHDESLTVNIPGVSADTKLTAYTHFYPDVSLPIPLWGDVDVPQIGIIKAFNLELGADLTPPIELQIQYLDSALPIGADESSLRLYQRDGDNWKLLVRSSVDTDNNIVSYNGVDQRGDFTTELGDFAVMWGYPYGDVNPVPDGEINSVDVSAMIFHITGFWNIFGPPPTPPDPPEASFDPEMAAIVANVDGVGEIDVFDVQEVLQVALGLKDRFSVLGTPSLITRSSSNVAHTAVLSVDAPDNRVSVILDDATDIFAADIELTYDARLLRISEVSKTSLTSDSSIGYNDNKVGKLRSILVNGLPLNGAGSLMDVHFDLMPGASVTAAFDSIKLTQIELNGGLIKTALGKLPQKLALLQNYPNPFNPETWIPYELNQTADVEIRIYNINGQVVRRLSLGQKLPGSYITKDKAVYWDGTNDKGEKVSSGLYFYQLEVGRKNLVRKMVIMK